MQPKEFCLILFLAIILGLVAICVLVMSFVLPEWTGEYIYRYRTDTEALSGHGLVHAGRSWKHCSLEPKAIFSRTISTDVLKRI